MEKKTVYLERKIVYTANTNCIQFISCLSKRCSVDGTAMYSIKTSHSEQSKVIFLTGPFVHFCCPSLFVLLNRDYNEMNSITKILWLWQQTNVHTSVPTSSNTYKYIVFVFRCFGWISVSGLRVFIFSRCTYKHS